MAQALDELKLYEGSASSTEQRASDDLLKKIIYGIVVIGIALGCVSRFAALDFKPLWCDESVTITATNTDLQIPSNQVTTAGDIIKRAYTPHQISVVTNISHLYQNSREQLPLYYVGTSAWGEFFGTSPAALRSFSSVLGVLTMLATYFLGIELFSSPLAGLLSAYFIAVSPFHFFYSRTARPYALFALIIALSTAMLLRAIRKSNVTNWASYAVLALATMFSHAVGVAIIAAQGFGALCWRKKSGIIGFAVTAPLVGLTAYPWYFQLGNHSTPYNGWMYTPHHTPTDHVLQALTTLSTSIVEVTINQPLWVIPLSICAIISMAVIMWKKLGLRSLLLLALIVGQIVLLYPADLQWQHSMLAISRYLTPVFIAVPLMLAGTVIFLSESKKLMQRRLAATICALALIQGIAFCYQYFSAKYWHQPDRWVGAVTREVSKTPDALFVTDDAAEQLISFCSMLPATMRVMRIDKTMHAPDFASLGQDDFFYARKRHFRASAKLFHYSKTDGITTINPPRGDQ